MRNINNYADVMLTRIKEVIDSETKSMIKLAGAIVESINADGTVNVYFPPDTDKIFTEISNQSPFILNVGDSVELLVKNNNYSNCWVVAKHGANYSLINPDEGINRSSVETNTSNS